MNDTPEFNLARSDASRPIDEGIESELDRLEAVDAADAPEPAEALAGKLAEQLESPPPSRPAPDSADPT